MWLARPFLLGPSGPSSSITPCWPRSPRTTELSSPWYATLSCSPAFLGACSSFTFKYFSRLCSCLGWTCSWVCVCTGIQALPLDSCGDVRWLLNLSAAPPPHLQVGIRKSVSSDGQEETAGYFRQELRRECPGKAGIRNALPGAATEHHSVNTTTTTTIHSSDPSLAFALLGKGSLSSKLPVHLTILCLPSKNTYHNFLAVFSFICFLWSAFEIFVVSE